MSGAPFSQHQVVAQPPLSPAAASDAGRAKASGVWGPLVGLAVLIAVAALVTVAGLARPIIAVGVVYAVTFWFVALKRPDIALLLIFATAPLQNDLSGGGGAARFSLAEINLILAVPVMVIGAITQKRILSLGPLTLPMAFLFAVSVIATLYHFRGTPAALSLAQMFQYLVLTVLLFSTFARRLEDMTLALNGLIVVGLFLAILGLASGSNYILGLHKNGVGASIACAIIVAAERWLAETNGRRKNIYLVVLGILAAGLIFTLSRGAWLTALAGFIFVGAFRRQFSLMGRVLLALIPIIALCWYLLPSDSKEYALGFDSKRQNIADRYKSVDFALDRFHESPLLGSGVGLRKEYDATNVVYLTLAETGVVGMAAFVVLHLAFFRMIIVARRQIRPDEPLYSFLALGGALMLGKLIHGMVDHYWSRGDTMITWAAVGMALGVHVAIARRARRLVLLQQTALSLAPSASTAAATEQNRTRPSAACVTDV